MKCVKCGAEYELSNDSRIGFRAVCEKCSSYLHSCCNCKFYKIGRPNDCMIPGTEPIRDREHFNFCDEFKPKESVDIYYDNRNDAAKKLFGDDFEIEEKTKDPKDRFNSLFND